MRAYDPSIAAAHPARSAWVAANAGSGKTHTLANRVTRLLYADAKPERILCLTYTKAAAAEMQTRLFRQLGELAMLPDAALIQKLEEICGEAQGKSDLRKARRLFAQALDTPGGLKIQTIHGFCQSVLSRFPLEAGIAPAFRVLDEETANRLVVEARERVLETAGSGNEPLLATAVARLVTEISERRLGEILGNCLGTDRRKIERFFQTLPDSDDALARAVQNAHGVAQRETEDGIASAFCRDARAQSSPLREIVSWLDRGSISDRDRADALRAALALDPPRLVFGALRRAVLTADGALPQRLVTKDLARSNPTLLAQFETFAERLRFTEGRRRAARAAELCHAVLLVTNAVRSEYAAAKNARGVLDYDDLIVETKALLDRSEAAQWILFKLDGGLDHVLIDEAQDTSPEQWAIVSKLTEEFFAGSGARRDGILRTIFAVGDEKQSIFSFQGAEPEQFEHYREYFQGRALAADREFLNEPLATSRRSAPEILAFVDAVFSEPGARDGLTSSGFEIKHFAHRTRASGRIEFWPAIKPSKEPEPDPQREVDMPSEASPATKLAQRLAGEIKGWLDHRLRLPGHDTAVRPGDIMILLPRRNPFGSLIIRELKDRGIPVAGADRMRLTDEIAILDMLALGRFCIQPEDDLTLASLLRSPFCDLDEDSLLKLCNGRAGRLWTELQQRRDECEAFAQAHTFLSAMLARADFVPPFEFYTEALVTHGMRKRLLERLGAEAIDSIEEFLSLAFAFEDASAPSLEGFLDWIERGGAEVKRDMERGRNEVRVMTVHGAKGLEADIVILPDTTTLPQLPSEKGHLLYGPEGIQFPVVAAQQSETVVAAKSAAQSALMREHRRLLYVALTRAKDRLYICGFENKRGISDGSWYRLTQGAAERLGLPIKRGGETIRVIGDIGEQFSLDIEPERPAAPVPAWVSKAPEEPQHPRLIRPSGAMGGDEPVVISPRGRRGVNKYRRGLLVHALLSHLSDLAVDERETVARRFLRRRVQEDTEIDALLRETLAVLSDARFSPAFAPGSRAEVALTAELPELGPGARINGRIDRLAVTDDEVLIVDFKTNRPPPAREADVAAIYLAQMALYRMAAAKIFPRRRIACALVWTDGPSLIRLSDEVLDRQFREIRTRLDPRGGRS